MKNKLKMLGYKIFEHTDMVSIAISKSKVRLIIIKNDEVYLDTHDLSNSIESIYCIQTGLIFVIKVNYEDNCTSNYVSKHTLKYTIDSNSNVLLTGNKSGHVMEDGKHWMAVDDNKIYIHDKKSLENFSYNFEGTNRKNMSNYCSTNEHCVLLDTTFVDTRTGDVVVFDSIAQCGRYLLCGYRLSGIANFSVGNVQGIISVDNGNLYTVTKYEEIGTNECSFTTLFNGTEHKIVINPRENRIRTAFRQRIGEIIRISRN